MSLTLIPAQATGPAPTSGLSHRPGDAPALFSIGALLTIDIEERVGLSELLVKINNQSFLARTNIPHSAGERLKVEVESLHPTVVLKIVQEEGSPAGKLQEYLRYWRANPRSLNEIFIQAKELSKLGFNDELRLLGKEINLDSLLKLINALTFSHEAKGGSLYLKNFIHLLGLSLENSLLRRLSQGQGKTSTAETLKSAILTLLRELEALPGKSEPSPRAQLPLNILGKFLNSSLKAIETLQAVNIYSWELDNKYILQIPFLLGDDLRMSDLFISKEPSAHDSPDSERWRFFLYLDMDLLGEIAVDIRAWGSNLDCLFLSQKAEVVDFIFLALPSLTAQLKALGYKTGDISCRVEMNLPQTRQELINSYLMNQVDLVDTFA